MRSRATEALWPCEWPACAWPACECPACEWDIAESFTIAAGTARGSRAISAVRSLLCGHQHFGEARAFEDCLDHARRVRAILAGDVQRGAVIGRRAREREPHRDVHGAAERRDLDRGHADIVIG